MPVHGCACGCLFSKRCEAGLALPAAQLASRPRARAVYLAEWRQVQRLTGPLAASRSLLLRTALGARSRTWVQRGSTASAGRQSLSAGLCVPEAQASPDNLRQAAQTPCVSSPRGLCAVRTGAILGSWARMCYGTR